MRRAAACLTLVLAGSATAQDTFPAPQPFGLTYTRDDTRAVTKHIEAEDGGFIDVTNAAGDRIRLKIEPDTLYYDETITLTPLDGATGIDGAERMIAVAMEPSGVEFSSPAALTVTPKDALSGDIWWFESPEGLDGSQAQPALPLKGQSGMMVWHFSTGAVATGGPAIGQAVDARAPGQVSSSSTGVSRSWLDWRQAKTEQDYQSGRIDSIKRDTELGMINDLKERLAAEAMEAVAAEIYEKLDQGMTDAGSSADRAAKIAKNGDPADLERLTKLVTGILEAERMAQLMGRPESDLGPRANEIIRLYADGVADRCSERRDLGPQTAQFVLGLEREMELNGQSPDYGDSRLVACIFREWSAGPVEDTTYGLTTVTIRKAGCSMGVWGKYIYAAEGAVAGSFEFVAKPPKDNFVVFTPVELAAKLTPEYLSASWTCKQKGEAAIGEPPGAFFHVTSSGSAVCKGPDDIGTVALIYTNALPLRAGPLCKQPKEN